MGRCNSYLVSVEKFYRYQTFDHIAFGYISGLRKALPSMSLVEAMELFLITFEFDEESYCIENLRQSYYRILNSLIMPLEKTFKPPDDLIL